MTERPLGDATTLAVDRTRLAHERTLMAWVRTSTSLISFGFTIYKFFQYVRETQNVPARWLDARGFALLMISIGLAALALATVEHRRSLVKLRREYGDDLVPHSLATTIAFLIAALGIIGLLAVVFGF